MTGLSAEGCGRGHLMVGRCGLVAADRRNWTTEERSGD